MRPSSLEKRRAIIAAALQSFLRDGYDRANLEEIAGEAGVSKQTLYTHFGSKKELFREVVIGATTAAFETAHAPGTIPTSPDELGDYFRDYARMLYRTVLDPGIVGLRRLIIREAGRFPQLASSFHEHGPKATQTEMSTRIQELNALGLMNAPDSLQAASVLNWLILAEPLNRAMMLTDAPEAEAGQAEQHVKEAVRVFLAAYVAKT